MIGRRAVVGLSLLCALAFCAIAASSAAAADGFGTTQFTCAKTKVAKTGEFENEDCDKTNPKKEGEWEHVGIALKTKISAVGTDPAKGTFSKVVVGGEVWAVECKEGATSGTSENEEPVAKMHKTKGTGISFIYTKCVVEIGKELPCPVTKFELTNLKSIDVENQNLSYTTDGKKVDQNFSMGIKFEPTVGTKLGEIAVDKTCKGGAKTLNVEGAFLGVPIGARLVFASTSSEPTMKIGGAQASLVGEMTLHMSGAGGNPITETTTDKLGSF